MKQRFEIQLPFTGFYYSIHADEIGFELEYVIDGWAESMPCDIPDSLMELFQDAADYGNAQREYSKYYAESFGDEYLDGDCEFVEMTSPREYNFATDKIFVTIGRATLAKIYHNADKSILTRIALERHSSRAGFISFYKPEWRSWGALSQWDHNQFMTLILAYLETERGEEWDQWAEWNLCEDISCNGLIHNWLWTGDKSNRAWKIYNYLTHDRVNRAVKTMAQWRVTFAKAWETTPLGGITTGESV